MAWIMSFNRIGELQTTINGFDRKEMQLNRFRNQLITYSSAIADGYIAPNELDGLGSELFGVAMDFSMNSSDFASQAASMKIEDYQMLYEQAQANGTAGDIGALQAYMTADGSLNYDAMYHEFYQQALTEFSENFVTPQLNEIQKQIDNEMLELNTLRKSAESEYESLKSNLSNDIQQGTIRLA